MERKAEKGLWNGGARPLGYVVDKATQKLVINPAEAATVRLIFDSYTTDRLGTQAIAAMLNHRGLRTRMGKPWSQHTVEHIITNRVYIGEKRFADIAVADAHPAIIQPDQFDLAQRILGKRSADIGQRAANPSEYELTGRIRCPQCGRRYVGTAAHGRNHRYRYYICWSRARYGTQAGCDNHRFNADELEKAMRQAVLEFYSTGYDIIARAVTEYQASHAKSSSANRDQLAAVAKQLKDNSAALDRYLTAFENGTLTDDDDNIKARLATLRDQARQLRTRKIQLEAELEQPPAAPEPAALSKIRTRIREIFDHGNHIAKKALFEALIEEIVINSDDSLTPIFKIPVFRDGQEPDLQGPAPDQIRTADTVRALLPMVELLRRHSNCQNTVKSIQDVLVRVAEGDRSDEEGVITRLGNGVRRAPLATQARNEIVDQFRSGRKIREIAEALGVSQSCVKTILRRRGVRRVRSTDLQE